MGPLVVTEVGATFGRAFPQIFEDAEWAKAAMVEPGREDQIKDG